MAGIGLLTAVAVGVFVFGRTRHVTPVRYRSIASIRIAPKPNTKSLSQAQTNVQKKRNATSTTLAPNIVLTGPTKFALRKPLIRRALKLSKLKSTSGIQFNVRLDQTQTLLGLVVTAPTRYEAQKVAREWGDAFAHARRVDAKRTLKKEKFNLNRRVTQLHNELRRIDATLVKIMPIVYHGVLRFDQPLGTSGGVGNRNNNNNQQANAPPPVPEQGSIYGLNLAFERVQLLSSLADSGAKAAALRISSVTPEVFASLEAQTRASRVAHTRATTLPALGGLFGGLLLALVAALITDRADRMIRDPEEAAHTFAAPVLSMIPADGDEFTVIAEPLSPAAEAYRGLAAMSISTDRLPRALMVSTPTGDAHTQVAANFAAALSRLGLKVALVATSPDQDWYLERFTAPGAGVMRLPELLGRAQSGTLSPRLPDTLPHTDSAPNLVVVPPADQPVLHLPIDGLPPLLRALADDGIDITIISGPPLLEEADATIVAWAARNILWALVPGEITRAEARAAAARMELAGVTPFGVVMIEQTSLGA